MDQKLQKKKLKKLEIYLLKMVKSSYCQLHLN